LKLNLARKIQQSITARGWGSLLPSISVIALQVEGTELGNTFFLPVRTVKICRLFNLVKEVESKNVNTLNNLWIRHCINIAMLSSPKADNCNRTRHNLGFRKHDSLFQMTWYIILHTEEKKYLVIS